MTSDLVKKKNMQNSVHFCAVYIVHEHCVHFVRCIAICAFWCTKYYDVHQHFKMCLRSFLCCVLAIEKNNFPLKINKPDYS